jgi:hypothetical protein
VELAILIVTLIVLGSLVRGEHAVPQEIAALAYGPRIDSPYLQEPIRVIYRIATIWRVEGRTLSRAGLCPHFEVVTPSRYKIRKLT